jgi:hypothetical protein
MTSGDDIQRRRTREIKAAIAKADAGDFATDRELKAAFDAFHGRKQEHAEKPFDQVIRQVQAFFATVGPKNGEVLVSEQLMRERREEAARENNE